VYALTSASKAAYFSNIMDSIKDSSDVADLSYIDEIIICYRRIVL
jgi:hypothetical protein